MKIKTNYDGCPYITAGKEYELTNVGENTGCIKDDFGDSRFIRIDRCAHIDYHNWQVVEQERFSQEVAQEMYDLLEEMCETYDDNVYLYIDDIREVLAKARGE